MFTLFLFLRYVWYCLFIISYICWHGTKEMGNITACKHLYYNHTAQWSEQRYTSLATWRLTCPVLLFSTSLTSLMFVSSFCICQLADYVFHGFTLGFWKAAHLSWTKGLELLEQNGQQWRHWYGSGEWLLMHIVQLLDAGSIIKELLPVLTEKKGKTWIKRLNTKH